MIARSLPLLMLLLSLGCSFLGVRRVPDHVAPGRDDGCTSGYGAPIADAVGALGVGAPSLYVSSVLLGFGSNDQYSGLRNAALIIAGLGVVAGIVYGESAIYGFSSVSRCRDLSAQSSTVAHARDSGAGQRALDPEPGQRGARDGAFFDFGAGGGSVSAEGTARPRELAPALGFGLRLGYGFQDRLQIFAAFGTDTAFYQGNEALTDWRATFRVQTLLAGDRAGNGLNLNLGFGFGALYGNSSDTALGPALAGGISYDLRLTPQFGLSPELQFSLLRAPRLDSGVAQAWTAGLQLRFVSYASPSP